MKFNIGDEVSFLNEKLDGRVYSIVSSTLVKVETKDGFVIDALASELVLVKKAGEEKTMEAKTAEPKTGLKKEHTFIYSANTVQFISGPAEENKLMTGNVNFFIYNCTGYELLFALFEQRGRQKIFKVKGSLGENAYAGICNYGREELMDVNNFIIQLIFSGGSEYRHPVVKDISLVLPSLSGARTGNAGTTSFASYVEVVDFNQPKEEELFVLKDTLQTAFQSPLQKRRAEQKNNLSEKQIKAQGIILNTSEVDLHIEELISDFSHMSKQEIIAVQLKRVADEMEKALKSNYHSLVFIHGIGNGKLKESVREELKKYPNVSFRDADYSRYGGGATEVIL